LKDGAVAEEEEEPGLPQLLASNLVLFGGATIAWADNDDAGDDLWALLLFESSSATHKFGSRISRKLDQSVSEFSKEPESAFLAFREV